MYDLLLRGARIVDGTGNPWQSGDVAITGQKIAAVGRLGRSSAQRVIDVSGRVVSPGFIDIHGHSDYLVLADPLAENKLWQGITTGVAGNCGFSAAPLGEVWLQEWWVENPDDRFTVVPRAAGRAVLARHGIELNWSSLGEYFARDDLAARTNPGTGRSRPAAAGDAGRHTEYTNHGIELVIVNGQVVPEGGAPTGAASTGRPGKILRRRARRL